MLRHHVIKYKTFPHPPQYLLTGKIYIIKGNERNNAVVMKLLGVSG